VLDLFVHSSTLDRSGAGHDPQNLGMRQPARDAHTGGMWEERTLRVSRDISALAAAGSGVHELHSVAIAMITPVVPIELACFATVDPQSLVISGMTSGVAAIPIEYEPHLARAEYSPDEPHRWAALAEQGRDTARLSELTRFERDHSLRYTTVWQPIGMEREIRVVFRADGACWGAAGLVRSGPDFSERETDFLTAIAPILGSATRAAVRAEAGVATAGNPAIVVLGATGDLVSATGSAQDWQQRVDAITPGRFLTMMRVVVAGATSSPAGEMRALLRDGDGRWAFVQASLLRGGPQLQVAVSLQPAGGERLQDLLLAAYGLSPRERDVSRQVILGHDTSDIADRLFISANTVQDHLKSIFAKVGVRSRVELVARLHAAGPPRDSPTLVRYRGASPKSSMLSRSPSRRADSSA
jgi:DNA-binding CsgD family transcriptional regulator